MNTILCFSQQQHIINKAKIGIELSYFGSSNILFSLDEDGDDKISGDNFYTAGILFLFPFSNYLSIETGLTYGEYKFQVTPYGPSGNSYPKYVSLINIPVTFRVSFMKYLFINGGPILDLSLTENKILENATGIGSFFGTGVNYGFPSGFMVFVQPYISVHSLLSLHGGIGAKKLVESGFRIGFLF